MSARLASEARDGEGVGFVGAVDGGGIGPTMGVEAESEREGGNQRTEIGKGRSMAVTLTRDGDGLLSAAVVGGGGGSGAEGRSKTKLVKRWGKRFC
ncbi:hypothetical protein Acr_18g0004880 [Actinidia rufa]|uniref:Uncharacterized protein n=1 Tax=Actinidia rufa TaxID=165716 RepID=A0A7J0G6A5_9ERIC|nr:hypothetical protein Acr_18g0004880 [Actinidia rufa]